MEVARIRVSRTSITVLERNTIPAGLIGGTITIEYADASWGDLKKTVVFKGTVTKDVVTDDNSVRIPGEVLAEAGKKLYVGVYGTDLENNRAIPTLYADLGVIKAAADPYDDSTADPALPMWHTLSQKVDEFDKKIDEFDKEISGFSDELTRLVGIASDSAVAAEKASDDAKQAAADAKEAAKDAENAISGVEAAANNANTAAANAANAASAANQAANSVNSVIQNANSAANLANAAAEATNTARESLTTAASSAIEEIRNAATTGIDGTAIVQPTRGEVISIDDSADRLLRGLKVFGKTTQNGTPTPDAPVPLKSVGDVKVTVCGRNLLDMTNGRSNTATGVTYTKNADGSYNRAGTAENQYGNIWFLGGYNKIPGEDNVIITLLPGKVYFVRDCALYTADSNGAIAFYDNFSSITGAHVNKAVTVNPDTYPDGVKITGVRCPQLVVGNSYNDTIYPSIYLGENDPGWEPYNGNTIHISTDHGLPGIPVTSGGNYTDSSGRQWLCDEVDFEKGVYIQRVETKTLKECTYFDTSVKFIYCDLSYYPAASVNIPALSNKMVRDVLIWKNRIYGTFNVLTTSNADWKYMCRAMIVAPTNITTKAEATAWLAEQNIDILYRLHEPKEYELTAQQIATFAALHSNYPNTIVFNDKVAGMEVKYVADTKSYVDDNVAELVDLIMDLEPGGSVSDERISQVVEEVLEEHPKLKDVEEAVAENANTLATGYIGSDTPITTTWVVGAINSSDGKNVDTMTNRVRSDFIPADKGLVVSILGNNAEFCPVYYNASYGFISSPGVYQKTALKIHASEVNATYVKLMIRNSTATNDTLTADYGNNIGLETNCVVQVFYTPEETKDAIVETMQNGTFEQESNALSTTWVVGAIDTSKGTENNTMNNRLRCDYISTANGLNVAVLGNNAEFCPVYYDKDYKFISSPSAYQKTNLQIGQNTSTAYVRLMIRNSTATNTALAASYGANIGLTSVAPIKITKKVYYPADLSGKKIVFLGDSIPHGQSYAGDIPIPYPKVVADNLGMTLVNYGIGGSTIAQQTNYGGAFRSKTDFDYATKDTTKYYQVITGQTYTTYAYSNGAWTTSTTSLRTPISARYSFMDNDAEIVCVHCTTNDFQYNWTDVGTFEDTGVNTYYGALHTLIKGLMQKYKGKTIFFITPLKRAQDPYTTATSVNDKGKTLKEYRDILMEVCAYYGIPVIDAWAISGLNPYLSFQADMWDSVLTHPLQKGHKLLGDIVASQILAVKRFATP